MRIYQDAKEGKEIHGRLYPIVVLKKHFFSNKYVCYPESDLFGVTYYYMDRRNFKKRLSRKTILYILKRFSI